MSDPTEEESEEREQRSRPSFHVMCGPKSGGTVAWSAWLVGLPEKFVPRVKP
jgi:hypothetical protein